MCSTVARPQAASVLCGRHPLRPPPNQDFVTRALRFTALSISLQAMVRCVRRADDGRDRHLSDQQQRWVGPCGRDWTEARLVGVRLAVSVDVADNSKHNFIKALIARMPPHLSFVGHRRSQIFGPLSFVGHRRKSFWNGRKNLNNFGQNVWK